MSDVLVDVDAVPPVDVPFVVADVEPVVDVPFELDVFVRPSTFTFGWSCAHCAR